MENTKKARKTPFSKRPDRTLVRCGILRAPLQIRQAAQLPLPPSDLPNRVNGQARFGVNFFQFSYNITVYTQKQKIVKVFLKNIVADQGLTKPIFEPLMI
jgi:hypothetical protein